MSALVETTSDLIIHESETSLPEDEMEGEWQGPIGLPVGSPDLGISKHIMLS
jgi:hypothetical protein